MFYHSWDKNQELGIWLTFQLEDHLFLENIISALWLNMSLINDLISWCWFPGIMPHLLLSTCRSFCHDTSLLHFSQAKPSMLFSEDMIVSHLIEICWRLNIKLPEQMMGLFHHWRWKHRNWVTELLCWVSNLIWKKEHKRTLNTLVKWLRMQGILLKSFSSLEPNSCILFSYRVQFVSVTHLINKWAFVRWLRVLK